jgi:hypothetical protein
VVPVVAAMVAAVRAWQKMANLVLAAVVGALLAAFLVVWQTIFELEMAAAVL